MNRPRSTGQPWLRAVPATATEGSEVEPDRPLCDEALIEGVVRGDAKIAGRLYDRLVGVVDRALYRVFGRREPDHDDLVQATFEQIVLTLTRRRFAGACSLSSWACSVASHVGLNALRARRRERGVMSLAEDASALPTARSPRADAEHEVGVRKEIDRVRWHLSTMAPEKAETILLHDVFGHDLSEIAVLTGVSVSAAQTRLVRGRKELFAKLQADGHGDAGFGPSGIHGGERA